MTNFLSSLYILEINLLSDVGLVKIFSYSVGCYFVLLTVSFALQKFLSFRRFHLLFRWVSVLLGLYLESDLLSHCVQVYFPLSFLWGSVCLVLCWGLWSIWNWVLCIVIAMDLFAFFYMLIFNYASTICWIYFLFSIWYFLLLCQKSGIHRCVIDI